MIEQEEIHKKCLSVDSEERIEALRLIRNNYPLLPDKQHVWNDLIKLTSDQDSEVRYASASFLGAAVSQVPDKQQVWDDLIKLTTHKEKDIRYEAASSLSSAFSDVTEKQQAWNDLIRLTSNNDSDIRYIAASSLGFAFPQLPDKQKAWNDLHRVVEHTDVNVRRGTASSLGFAFPQLPDKQKAWNDLHKFTLDQDVDVRKRTVRSLGSAYPHVPDKQQAWEDLIKMAADENNDIKALANYSLGKASIFKASQAKNEEDCKMELEVALDFFEAAAQQSTYKWLSPSQFCLPFYHSFHTIVFNKCNEKEVVDKYLTEAKDAVKDSKSKELLLKAVENLASSLKEVQNLDFTDKKERLNSCRKYCETASELMKSTEKSAPYATELIRKGLPILDQKLKNLLDEIQEKAKNTCKESKGTVTEEIACTINKEVQKWEMGSPEEMVQKVENIAYVLKKKIGNIPENEYVLNRIEAMRHERNMIKQYEDLLFLIEQIPTMIVVSELQIKQQLEQQLIPVHHKLDNIYDNTNLIFSEIVNIKDKLSCISFDISRIKLNSADFISNLKIMKKELEKLDQIEGLNKLSIEKLDSIQAEKLNGLNRDILARLDEIGILANKLPNKEDAQKILDSVNKLKQSKSDKLLQDSSTIVSLIGFAMQVFPYIQM